jgi:hypothetical protein
MVTAFSLADGHVPNVRGCGRGARSSSVRSRNKIHDPGDTPQFRDDLGVHFDGAPLDGRALCGK